MLKGRVAIITGAVKGIGFGISKKFAENGCHIVFCVHHELQEYPGGLDKVKSIEKCGVTCHVVQADVSNAGQVSGLVKDVMDRFDKVDILVNNAAYAPHPKSIIDIQEEEWDAVLSVNLKAAFLLCKEVGPHMKAARYGKIINISAISSMFPLISEVHYNSSKAALNMLTKDVALEFAPFNINVNCICPGVIQTELIEKVVPEGMSKEAFFDAFAKKIVPMERVGQPEEIANAALFLASEMGSYVTGEVLAVAGGVPLRRSM
jgi:3-oxoacyl-[acyl-carrier protein] reductase